MHGTFTLPTQANLVHNSFNCFRHGTNLVSYRYPSSHLLNTWFPNTAIYQRFHCKRLVSLKIMYAGIVNWQMKPSTVHLYHIGVDTETGLDEYTSHSYFTALLAALSQSPHSSMTYLQTSSLYFLDVHHHATIFLFPWADRQYNKMWIC